MFTLTIFGFGPGNGSTEGTLGMKFEPERLAFGGIVSGNSNLYGGIAPSRCYATQKKFICHSLQSYPFLNHC